MSETERLRQRIQNLIKQNDARRRRTISHRLAGRLVLWLLERAEMKTGELCLAYGGPGPDGSSRLCERPRWHWDSHVYGRLQRPDGSVVAYMNSGQSVTARPDQPTATKVNWTER